MIKDVLETLLNCFVMNSSDELVTNEKWHKLSKEDKDHIRMLFGSEHYEIKKVFKASNGIVYPYKTLDELCYIMCCIQCPNEHACHNNCETCDEYEEQLEELEKEND